MQRDRHLSSVPLTAAAVRLQATAVAAHLGQIIDFRFMIYYSYVFQGRYVPGPRYLAHVARWEPYNNLHVISVI